MTFIPDNKDVEYSIKELLEFILLKLESIDFQLSEITDIKTQKGENNG